MVTSTKPAQQPRGLPTLKHPTHSSHQHNPCEGWIRNTKIRDIFYDIPDVEHMIAARQLDFIGKAIRGPHDWLSRCMITACCKLQRRVGRPQTHTKNTMVQNLQLLFKNVPTTTIDRYDGSKDWINEASDEKYWTALVQCLLHSDAPLPERPPTWGPTPGRSTCVPPPPAPPPTDRDHNHKIEKKMFLREKEKVLCG